MWQRAMKLDYTPIVHVAKVKPKAERCGRSVGVFQAGAEAYQAVSLQTQSRRITWGQRHSE